MSAEPAYILGISAFYHDSAACLVKDGAIIAAAQEERFSRKKHDNSFPAQAAAYCLREAGITAQQLAAVAFYEKPFLKFERIMASFLSFAPGGIHSFLRAVSAWVNEKLWIRDLIARRLRFRGKIFFCEHHESHAASAFFPSPFDRAAFLTLDGAGEWATASFGVGEGNALTIMSELSFPHSLGLLYSAFTYYLGFRVNSGEYKMMGLAPYGEPVFKDLILSELIDLKEDGSFHLNIKYFDYCAGLHMINRRFEKLFGASARSQRAKLEQHHMDIASSIQSVTADIMVRMARHVRKVTGQSRLCLAGGVALNCAANGRILREAGFDDLWIQPAAGDAGGALGAALSCWYQCFGNERKPVSGSDAQQGSFLGPAFSDEYIHGFLSRQGIPFTRVSDEALIDRVADLIAQEKVVGWFQGRMEFGPRALGNRSILGDARSVAMQKTINAKVKGRESFRPLAPSVLRESAQDYFELETESPYMLLVCPVKQEIRRGLSAQDQAVKGMEKLKVPRSTIPAVTHVDCSCRVQTVDRQRNARFYDLIKRFKEKYGCAAIINTSLNLAGDPIVCTPEQAYRCFMRSHMDCLVLGNHILEKDFQKRSQDNGSVRAA